MTPPETRAKSDRHASDRHASARHEGAPHEALALYEAILSSTLDPIVTINARGVIQTVSDSIERVFGWTPDELIGRNVAVLMPEPHRTAHDGYLHHYRQTGKPHILNRTREFDGVRKDGTPVPIEISVARVEVPGRDEPMFTGIIHDVSARKRTEAEKELIQRLTLESSASDDLETGLQSVVREIATTIGWPFGEVWLPSESRGAGKVVLNDGPCWFEDRPELHRFRERTIGREFVSGSGLPGRVFRTRRPEWIGDLSTVPSSRFTRRNDALDFGLRAAFGVPVLVGDDVVAVMSFFTTETQTEDRRLVDLVTAAAAPIGPVILRRRMENALHESERRFRDMLNRIDLVAIMVDLNERIVFCDDYLLELTGWQREEVIGRNWFDLFIPEAEAEPLRRVLRDAGHHQTIPQRLESGLKLRGGGQRTIVWSTTLMHDAEGRVIGATGVGVDVTDQRRIEGELQEYRDRLEKLVVERTAALESSHEQLRQADRLASIGTLAAGLGHDMHNVLLPARCRLDALDQDPSVSADAKEQLHAIRRSIEYLQQLSDGLHLFALNPEDAGASGDATDLAHWWDQVGPLISRAVPKSVRFDAIFPEEIPLAQVAPHRLTQAVLNLVVNAGEAVSAPGHVRLTVRVSDDRGLITISVADDGCGMTDDVRRQAMDPFYTTKKRGIGTGLGLSLVRGVVQAANGNIDIRSSPDRGTVIRLTFAAVRLPSAASASSGGVRGPRARAAVTATDPRLASLLNTMLRAAGLDVVVSTTSDPGACAIWLVDPDRASAEQLVAVARRGTSILLLGVPPTGQGYDYPHIEDPHDFEALRGMIGEVLNALPEPSA